MQSYEVEVKSLLGSEESAEVLRARMRQVDPNTALVSRNKQLNHYFTGLPADGRGQGGSMQKLGRDIAPHLAPELLAKLKDMSARGNAGDFSVRTRDKDGTVLLV